MQDCLSEMNATGVTMCVLESMAIRIHESMSSSSRNYHSVQHVFDISHDLTDPIAILSAFFHDCIYFHVDGGLNRDQARRLRGTYKLDADGNYKFSATAEEDCGKDRPLHMVECIFGYSPGQEITPRNGLNEFLSAVIAVKELKDHLTVEQLAQIACCIEGTIPFRSADKETGRTPMDRLYSNMELARSKCALEMSDEELVKSVQRAAMLSNNDVGNFGTTDRLWFLDNTWSLLPETNQTLREQYLYTINEFHLGIFKMHGFFGFLQPKVVFHSFRGFPPEKEVAQKIEECAKNMEIGRKYIGAKLLAMSVLAAFAELTGGDAPMSLFMGDLPSRHHVSTKIEDALPTPPKENLKNCHPDVYNILANGRRTETSFDIRQSPLAAYLYGCLGDDGLQNLLQNHKMHPVCKENAMELLKALPRDVVEALAQNMMKVALSRAEMIQGVIDTLPPASKKSRSLDSIEEWINTHKEAVDVWIV